MHSRRVLRLTFELDTFTSDPMSPMPTQRRPKRRPPEPASRRSSWLVDFLVGLMSNLAASLMLLYGTPLA